ncbi:MAG: rhodanese-like domain-containing protein [Desulfuromonadales bacterium]|nr:rhodanese-like domain-containing protein [Desulfuromonadales bacterium]
MRKCVVLLLAVALFALVSSPSFAAMEYVDIDAAGVKTLMATEDALVIFPLSPIEFDDLHIKGSVNIPMGELEKRLPQNKNEKVIFYCLGVKCVASWRAAEKAVSLGYRNVYAFREGLPAWVAAGYPTDTTAPLPDVEITKISTTDLAYNLGKDNFTLLDINLDDDAKKFWIEHPNRIHIPLDELHLNTASLNKSHRIAVICLKGKRSPTAVRYLKSQGFEDVVMVQGGTQKWVLEGRPVQQGF